MHPLINSIVTKDGYNLSPAAGYFDCSCREKFLMYNIDVTMQENAGESWPTLSIDIPAGHDPAISTKPRATNRKNSDKSLFNLVLPSIFL